MSGAEPGQTTNRGAPAADGSMGAALFFGLIVLTLITQGEQDIDTNPQTSMEPAVFAAPAPAAEVARVATIPAATRFADLRAPAGADLLDRPSGADTRITEAAAQSWVGATDPGLQTQVATPTVAPPEVPRPTMPPPFIAATLPLPGASLVGPTAPGLPPVTSAPLPAPALVTRTTLAPTAPAEVSLPAAPTPFVVGPALPPPTALVTRPADRWEDPRDPGWAAEVTGARVNLREGPTTDSASLALILRGTTAQVVETRGAWLRIRVDGLTGWMFGTYLAPVDAAE